jgi:hypothetical protein
MQQALEARGLHGIRPDVAADTATTRQCSLLHRQREGEELWHRAAEQVLPELAVQRAVGDHDAAQLFHRRSHGSAGFQPTRPARSEAAEVDPAQLSAPRLLGHLASVHALSTSF